MPLTTEQATALGAVDEALRSLGMPTVSVNYDSRFESPLPFIFTSRLGNSGDYIAASGATLADAAAAFFEKAEAEATNPILRKPSQAKAAALALVNEYRESGNFKSGEASALDELADRIAGLPVKE